MNEGSLANIREVAKMFLRAFEPAAQVLKQQGHLE